MAKMMIVMDRQMRVLTRMPARCADLDADADNDGYGGLEDNHLRCEQPVQYTSIDDAIDCNDLNANANPLPLKPV